MIKKGLVFQLGRSFFNSNKKPSQQTTAKIEKPRNKRYLVQSILQANKHKAKLLPPPKDPSKITVVLQLDQVLAFTFTPDEEGYLMSPRRKQDFHLWFQDYECLLNIYKRKNLDNFLAYLNEQCEPVIFSAGVKSYVQLVMSLIDPTKKIKHILTQQHCNHVVEDQSDIDEFVKDLSLLGRDMSKVVYIDSKPMSFWLQPQNGLCTSQFKADNSMRYQDLDEMILEIQQCRKCKDVREYLLQEYNLIEDFKKYDLL